MSRTFWRRFFVMAASLLLGLFLTEGVKRLFSPPLNNWVSFILTAILVLITTTLGLFLETYIQKLNRELEESTNQRQSELDQLNIKLALQTAEQQQAQAIAQKSEDRFRNLAENIQEGLTILENGKVVYMNDRACQIFGDCPDGDVSERFSRFALPKEIERLRDSFSDPNRLPLELQYWIKSKNGEQCCIREHYSLSHANEETRIFIVTSDVTEHEQAFQTLEQAVSDRTREFSTVLEISKRIASTLELEPLLNLILDQIASIIPYSAAAIYTLENGTRLKVAAHQIPGLSSLPASLTLSLEDAGPFRPAITEKRVLILEDVNREPPLSYAFKAAGIPLSPSIFFRSRSWIGIPLILRNRITGLLSLTHEEPGYYTETHARLAQAITNQVAIAIENARLYAQAQDLATLEERNRIARELHDSVTQLLYGISLYSTAASRSVSKDNMERVRENLIEIKENALQALQEMRLLILELDPPLLQKYGLVAALEASLESIESRAGLETVLKTDGMTRLPSAIEPDLYRIAMEALNNLVRYARAKKVIVDLQIVSDWAVLDIRDNGVGFDVEYVQKSGGLGIHNMKQRAQRLGGRLDIFSTPGVGTHIKAEIPLQGHIVEPGEHAVGVKQ